VATLKFHKSNFVSTSDIRMVITLVLLMTGN